MVRISPPSTFIFRVHYHFVFVKLLCCIIELRRWANYKKIFSQENSLSHQDRNFFNVIKRHVLISSCFEKQSNGQLSLYKLINSHFLLCQLISISSFCCRVFNFLILIVPDKNSPNIIEKRNQLRNVH